MRTHRRTLLAVAALALVAGACAEGEGGGDDAGPVRTVEVEMADIAFKPDRLTVQRGETVRFVFKNTGKVAHDAFIGDADAQADHEKEMREGGGEGHGDGHSGDGEEAVTVDPGKSAEFEHTFKDGGSTEIGCHQPGHYAEGMKIAVDVA